jgi:hypothetical protein
VLEPGFSENLPQAICSPAFGNPLEKKKQRKEARLRIQEQQAAGLYETASA